MEPYIKELEAGLQAAVAKFHEEIQGVRTNRPSVQLIEDVRVDIYGQQMTVKQLGSLGIRPPRDIEVNIWDKNAVGAVVKAITEAKMGLSVTNDGNTVRVTLPPLTDERRAEFTKLVKKMAEEARIKVRAYRDEVLKKVKAAQDRKELSEDQVFKGKERLQKIVDGANEKVETTLGGKLKELAE
ncbi:MAG TPA: ribosome recycling factor [Candidatus Paceibacterota bacterium]|nr:ribosome recycling factor [Candidatus Paceibacterota bacterium]